MKKTNETKVVIEKDQKWEITKVSETGYEVKYFEYSKICDVWTYISNEIYSKDLIIDMFDDERLVA